MVGVHVDRIIMVPGMGADGRLFGPQQAAGLPIEPAPMVMPHRGDDIPTYAARVRDALDLSGSYAVGGVSFGGMVACELAQICRPRFLLLIASCRGGRAIPTYYHVAEWLSRLLPSPIIQRRCMASSRFMAKLEHLNLEQYHLIRDMSISLPVPFLRRVGRMILRWKGPAAFPCPVHQLHGEKDRIIPLNRVTPDTVVPGGGHLINLTHASIVNAYIQRILAAAETSVASSDLGRASA